MAEFSHVPLLNGASWVGPFGGYNQAEPLALEDCSAAMLATVAAKIAALQRQWVV
jgi:hypothetical protein